MADIDQTAVRAPSGIEWQGTLARTAGQGAAFNLYLALAQSADSHIHFDDNSSLPVEDDFPQRLNQYRRPPLKIDEVRAEIHKAWHEGLYHTNEAQHCYLNLWQSMHPDALSVHDDPMFITPDIIENCDLQAQRRLSRLRQTDKTAQTNAAEAYPTDATQLSELIELANSFSLAS